jgi:hypothetical protein
MAPDRRFDTWNTSSGKGHEWRPGFYFPDQNYRATRTDPLPPSLDRALPEILDPYQTTTGTVHDRKYDGGILANDRHQRAAANWKVHFIKDHVEKLENRRWRPGLTMGNQKSEMKDNYKGETKQLGVDFEDKSRIGPQGFKLDDHHKEGPSKWGEGSSENPELKAQPFYVKDRGILRELDPYISTTQKDHRSWDDMELKGYPRKNNATYWACEEYPKAWGHGPQNNPLPKAAVPRERPPMRDTLIFKSATRVPFWPRSAKPVPNGSYKSEHQSQFIMPIEERMRDAIYCPVDKPYTFHEPPPDDLGLPKHYDTMYQFYGNPDKVEVTS